MLAETCSPSTPGCGPSGDELAAGTLPRLLSSARRTRPKSQTRRRKVTGRGGASSTSETKNVEAETIGKAEQQDDSSFESLTGQRIDDVSSAPFGDANSANLHYNRQRPEDFPTLTNLGDPSENTSRSRDTSIKSASGQHREDPDTFISPDSDQLRGSHPSQLRGRSPSIKALHKQRSEDHPTLVPEDFRERSMGNSPWKSHSPHASPAMPHINMNDLPSPDEHPSPMTTGTEELDSGDENTCVMDGQASGQAPHLASASLRGEQVQQLSVPRGYEKLSHDHGSGSRPQSPQSNVDMLDNNEARLGEGFTDGRQQGGFDKGESDNSSCNSEEIELPIGQTMQNPSHVRSHPNVSHHGGQNIAPDERQGSPPACVQPEDCSSNSTPHSNQSNQPLSPSAIGVRDPVPPGPSALGDVHLDCNDSDDENRLGREQSFNAGDDCEKMCVLFTIISVSVVFLLMGVSFAAASFPAPVCSSDETIRYQVCEPCGSGTILFPVGGEMEKSWPKEFRAVLYFAGLIWCFQGIAIICDQFMAAIQEITSSEIAVWHATKDHTTKGNVPIKVWNPTMANLTLMALGSSAPEIMLSIIELMGNGFFTGELGPSTIVGSAAFNLFMITAVCILAVPADETRKIEGTSVFIITALTSVLAYSWLIIILQVTTPDRVDLWEAVITLLMFPILLVASFAADGGLGRCKRASAKKFGCQRKSLLDQVSLKSDQINMRENTLSISYEGFRASRGAPHVGVTISLAQTESSTVTSSYATRTTIDGDPHSSGSITFEPGETEKVISIPFNSLRLQPDARRFRFELENVNLPHIQLERTSCDIILPSSRCAANLDQQVSFLWLEQFLGAFFCGGSPEEQAKATILQKAYHATAIFWKVIFALSPPPALCGGWPCFFISLAIIGILTMLVGDLASLLGCCVGIPDDVTAITIVALGTSVPDTFASRLAAIQEDTADNAIGNVTGSNSVNVFLGLGLPWTMGAIYWAQEGKTNKWLSHTYRGRTFDEQWGSVYPDGGFLVPAGSLGMSVLTFTFAAIMCLMLLALRRQYYGGELGGPRRAQCRDAGVLVCLWLFYITVSVTHSLITND